MLKKHHYNTLLILIFSGCLIAFDAAADKAFSLNANTSKGSSTLETALPLTTAPEFLPVEKAYQLDSTASTDSKRLILNWHIAPGYYLYKHRFKFLDTENRPLSPAVSYQPGSSKYDDYYEKELEVFYNSTKLSMPLEGLPNDLQVESQACADAGLCYPPRRHQLKIDHTNPQTGVAETGLIAVRVVEAANAVPPESQDNAPRNTTKTETITSLGIILLFALTGGAILNLMPCVFPVLSIKALSMANSGLNQQRKHLHGLTYTLGVVSAFTFIAALLIALRTAGSAIGWGFQLQSPVFIGALVYLFTLMGFSFSGFFEFGTRLMSMGQSATTGHNLPATYMTGVLATVVASPCTAPFMGTALGFALTQSTTIALLIFIFLGIGMALPFLLISWWPGLANRMPHPGPWMESFKQFLAFPLYLSALWLLWVLGNQTDIDTVIALLIGVVLLSLAIWLSRHNRQGKHQLIRSILSIALIITAITLPFNSYQTYQKSSRQPAIWQPFTQQRLDKLLAADQAVFVNLTADWCITCLANEKLALSSEKFRQALTEKNIIYLKGDWTNYNPEITALLNRNGRNSVPLYLFYAKGVSQPSILPQLLTENIVLDAIDKTE
ncbi:MAG: protein-disulfide reductase DsbD [Porticoccaceae bacterium]|nr:protein-disulfide reductase DsbD [Pseudomonadales bacterium]MCP5172813.1 protein-disulfide reductase DsbD [Pseudomonadales bacterium]MCP5302287.1 protein-disulfide reductase DsbD [Pseudomonadales bacterium]